MEVKWDGVTVASKMTDNFFKLYLYKSLGPGSYETVDDYTTFPVMFKYLNFFEKGWRNKYGETLVDSAANP